MESQPQNPEFRIIPENFHPCMSTLCFILAAKALVRMHICGSWSQLSLLAHVISTKIHVMASLYEPLSKKRYYSKLQWLE